MASRLKRHVIDIPLVGGRNAGVNPQLLPSGQLLQMENCYFDRDGELRRRNGGTALGTGIMTAGGNVSAAVWVAQHREELVLSDGDQLYGYSPSRDAASQNPWISRGQISPARISTRQIGNTKYNAHRIDVVESGGYRCYLHETEDGYPCVTLIDTSTGTELLSSEHIDSATQRRYASIAVCGTGKFVVLYKEATVSNNIGRVFVQGFVSGNANVTPPTTLQTDCVNNADVKAVTLGASGFAIAYEENGTGDLLVRSYDSNATLQNSYKRVLATALLGYELAYVSAHDRVYCGYWQVNGGAWDINVVRLTTAMVADFAPVTVDTTPAGEETPGPSANAQDGGIGICQDSTTSTSVRVLYTYKQTTQREYRTRHATVTSAGAVSVAAADYKRNGALISKPFLYDSEIHAFLHRHEPTFASASGNLSNTGTALLVREDGEILARAFVNEHGGSSQTRMCVHLQACRDVIVDGTDIVAPFARAEAIASLPGAAYGLAFEYTVNELTVSMAAQRQPLVSANGVTYIGAGVLAVYDGNKVSSAGFHMNPPGFTAEGNGAGSVADGTYGVAIVYRWYDDAGNIYYSAPTFATVALAGGPQALAISSAAGTVDWAFNNLLDTGLTGVDLLLFRTLVGGSVYYFVSYHDVVTGYTQNLDMTGNDASIQNNALLYTTGGYVSAVLPPTPHHMAADGKTMALVPGDRRDTVWVSAPLVRTEGVRFSDDMIYHVPEAGTIEAVQWLNGRLILLCADQIRYMVGDAPNALGLDGYSDSRCLVRGVGCDDWRSVIETPAGILFRGGKGWHLVQPSMAVTYVGGPVEDYGPETVLDSVVLNDSQQVRIVMSSGDVLVWDYERGLWSVFTGLAAACCCLYGGSWTTAKATGTVVVEDSGTWRDPGPTTYKEVIRTAWIRPGAIAGFGRIWRAALTGNVQDHTHATETDIEDQIRWRAYVDYDDDTAAQTIVSTSTGGLGAAEGQPFMVRSSLSRQRVSSIMFEIELWSTQAFNEGLRLTGLTLDLGIDKGLARLAAANSV